MLRSIRWTLQLWHAGLLAVVLTAFGAMTFYEVRRARFAQIDVDLAGDVHMIAGSIRPNRGMMRFDGPPPGEPNGSPPDFDAPRPPPPDWERRGLQMRLSPGLQERFETAKNGAYYVAWGRNNEIIGSAGEIKGVPQPPANPNEPPPEQRRDREDRSRDDRGRGFGDGPPRGDGPRGDGFGPRDDRPGLREDRGGPPPPIPPTFRQRDNIREAYLYGPFGTTIVVGRSIEADRDDLRRLGLQLIATGAVVLAVGLLGGLALAARVIRPIKTITKAAQAISVKNLGSRIDVADTENELGQLAEVLNGTFARLDDAFRQQVRFTADASHELRTPLAVMHSATQLALSRDRSPEEYKKTLNTLYRASVRMKDLVDSLLLLAGADAGQLAMTYQPIDLAEIARDTADLLMPLAVEKNVSIDVTATPAKVSADAMRLGQVVTNLISNAIRYNRPGGNVRVSVSVEGSSAVLRVADTGIGIPPEHRPHVFERFYRVDPARTRAEGGSGLGLAIGRSIVAAHGGTISFENPDAGGTIFIVRLPILSA